MRINVHSNGGYAAGGFDSSGIVTGKQIGRAHV